MKKQKNNLMNSESLRRQAEEKLKTRQSKSDLPSSEYELLKLIHELEVHQIELEMQNEELVLAKEKEETIAREYTDLYDFAPSGYLTLTKEGNILELNFNAAKMLGKDRSLLKNRTFFFFLSEESKRKFRIFLDNVFLTKSKNSCEVTITTPGHNPVFIHLDGIVSHNDEFCLMTLSDITNLKNTEHKLIDREKQLHQIGDNIPKGQIYQFIISPDGEGRYSYVSKKVEELHECTAAQMIADHSYFDKRVLPEDLPEFQIASDKAINELSVLDHELRIKRKSGKICWHRIIARPRKGNNGEIIFDGIDFDITSQKEYEFKLQNYSAELEILNQDKDRYMSILAHDLRNPFNYLLGFSDLLLTNINVYSLDKIEDDLTMINHIVRKTFRMLEEILGWSNNNYTNQTLSTNGIYLYEICNYAIEENSRWAEDKNISLKCKISPNYISYNDDRIIKTVLRNLISNAIKFTDNKGTITIDSDESEHEFVVSVKDTGVGMNKEFLTHLFESNTKSSSPGTSKEKGSGMGLQICKEFLKKIGGKIWVESELGKGSVFYFSLPREIKV